MHIPSPETSKKMLLDQNGESFPFYTETSEVSHTQWATWLAWYCNNNEAMWQTQQMASIAVPLFKDIAGYSSPARIIDRINYWMYCRGLDKALTGSVRQYVDELLQDARINRKPAEKDLHDYSIELRSRITWSIDTNDWCGDNVDSSLKYTKFVDIDYVHTKPVELKAGAVSLTHYSDIEYARHWDLSTTHRVWNEDTQVFDVVETSHDVQLPYQLRYCELDPSYLMHHRHETQYNQTQTIEEWNAWLQGTKVDLFDKLCSGGNLTDEEVEAYCEQDYDVEGHTSIPVMDTDRPLQPELDAYIEAGLEDEPISNITPEVIAIAEGEYQPPEWLVEP